ncbi:MAG: transposase [Deltaproteobacteria bacterium]|nr:transposase [Deltaproteobacteria bacterium]
MQRNEEALAEELRLAGWRIYVSTSAVEDVSLVQAMALYREEWTVEHGYHRWKGGWLPALPLFLHIEQRIRGLMLLLLIALQVLSLIAWPAGVRWPPNRPPWRDWCRALRNWPRPSPQQSACCGCSRTCICSSIRSVTNGLARCSKR